MLDFIRFWCSACHVRRGFDSHRRKRCQSRQYISRDVAGCSVDTRRRHRILLGTGSSSVELCGIPFGRTWKRHRVGPYRRYSS